MIHGIAVYDIVVTGVRIGIASHAHLALVYHCSYQCCSSKVVPTNSATARATPRLLSQLTPLVPSFLSYSREGGMLVSCKIIAARSAIG